MVYKEIEGNLIHLAIAGEFDVIAHGCNCFCTMGAGIAPQMAYAFDCHAFPLEHEDYSGDINKLGQIDYEFCYLGPENSKETAVVNCYTQYGPGFNHKENTIHALSYPALILCLQKINHTFKGKHIGLPYVIGCGLAGGDPVSVIELIKKNLSNMKVTMVYLPQNSPNKHLEIP